LWQEIADNFYVERADFTYTRNLGEEFGDHLMSSYPLLVRRDLGNSIGSMLRPSSKEWVHIRLKDTKQDMVDLESKAWLEWATKKMMRVFYSPGSQFTRATKEGDQDFATFGQCAIQVSLNSKRDGMLYRTWHLRDVAWCEDEDGNCSTVYRKWKPKAIELKKLFGDNIHQSVKEKLEKEPYCEINVQHVILPSSCLGYGVDDMKSTVKGKPFVSVYLDIDNKHIMEEVGLFEQEYLIPRWQTVSGSQYAYSPSTVAALPDARLLQAMTLTLLEAGENAARPPMVAVQQAIRGDISLYSGGITWVDADYDERLGEVLRPITTDKSGIPLGVDMARDVRAMLMEAFYLNKLSLPPPQGEMTAYEVGQRVQEYIRQALPLFEPMESQYNGPLCEITFSKMLRAGAFGSMDSLPKGLRDKEIDFVFESPLHDATERAKGQRFIEASQMLAAASQIDPSAADVVDSVKALRDVLGAIGVPSDWQRSETQVAERRAVQEAKASEQEMLSQLAVGAEIAKTASEVQTQPEPQQAII
jgi:hypothetical protein